MTQLQLTLVNNSPSPTRLAIFQGQPADRLAVAWMAKYAYPGTRLQFNWDDTDYCFAWSQTGLLAPGVSIDAGQIVPASPGGSNQITLSYDPKNRIFFFQQPQSGGQPGALTVHQDSSLPINAAAVGIGMAGKPAFMLQSAPNMNLVFQPKPRYFVTAGTLDAGQLFEQEQVQAVEVVFPLNVTAMIATLNPDLSWTIQPGIFEAIEADSD